MTTLEENFQYYIDNQPELVKKYEGKYLLIKDRQVKEAFDSEIEAYKYAQSKFEQGSYIIQPCAFQASRVILKRFSLG